MEIQNNADDVEMVEDVGSLAQSLEASHFGKSLQHQAQLARKDKGDADDKNKESLKGLNIEEYSSRISSHQLLGGIGGVVERAFPTVPQSNLDGLGDIFFHTKPIFLQVR